MGRRDDAAKGSGADPAVCRPARPRSTRISRLKVVLVWIASAGLTAPLAGEEPPAANLPMAEEPVLLTPSDVRQGLEVRLQRMEEGRQARAQLRYQQAPRDYAAPQLDDAELSQEQVPLPLPPDAAGGELQLERAGGAR